MEGEWLLHGIECPATKTHIHIRHVFDGMGANKNAIIFHFV